MGNFKMANEHYECVMLLEKINSLISTLSMLSDEYYTKYIFNRGTMVDELLKDIGISEEYLEETLIKFEKLRIALYGDNVDWEEFARSELWAAARSERKHSQFQEDYIRKLEYELKELKKKQ